MMASLCGVVGLSEVVTPPRSRLSPSPRVRRGGDRLSESRSSPSPGVGRGGDRHLELRLSPSPGVRRGRDRRRRRGRVRALGSGEAEIPMAPEAGLGCCQPQPGGWRSSRSSAGGAVSCQVSQWRGEVTAVTSALSTGMHASG
jgi:hypothetical protein